MAIPNKQPFTNMNGRRNRRGRPSAGPSIRNTIRSMIEADLELKQTVVTSSTATSNAGAVFAVSQGIIQGDQVDQREGNQVTIKKICASFITVVDNASTVKGQFVRFMFFKDRFNQGATPTVADILAGPTVVSPLAVSVAQDKRFTILHDTLIRLSTTGMSAGISEFGRSMTHKITYRGATSVATANGPGSFWILVITDQSTAVPTFTNTSTMRFHDA